MSKRYTDSLNQHFFVVCDEFARLTPFDPNEIDNSDKEFWIPDDSEINCMVCGETFNKVYRRRHHCRNCGLLVCMNCIGNRAVIGDNIEKICDPCAAILLPVNPNTSFSGLKSWEKKTFPESDQNKLIKLTAVRFFSSLFKNKSHFVHMNAARTLIKFFPCHAPVLISSDAPFKLFDHSLTCTCDAIGLTLDLFLSMYNADPEACSVDLKSPEYARISPDRFLQSDRLDIIQAGARLLYLISSIGIYQPDRIDYLSNLYAIKDKWITAAITAALAAQYDITDIYKLKDNSISNVPKNAGLIYKDLLDLYDPKDEGSTTAAKYYASIVLERISRDKDTCLMLFHSDLEKTIQFMCQCSPRSTTDTKIDTNTSVYLCSMLRNIWLEVSKVQETPETHTLFGTTLMPMFEILGIPNSTKEESPLTVLQDLSLDIIQAVVSLEGMGIALKSGQMRELISNLTEGESFLSQNASLTLQSLSKISK